MGVFEQQRNQLQQSADARMAAPVTAPNLVGSLAPLERVTGVSLNPNHAGQNNATQAFYLRPESVGSNFNVNASLGGTIGKRSAPSTSGVTSKPDNLGNKKKDQF